VNKTRTNPRERDNGPLAFDGILFRHVEARKNPPAGTPGSARKASEANLNLRQPVSNFYTAGGGEAPAPTPVADLEATLKEIEDALAGLGEDDA
jgi:hypothetical protein